jgi:ribosome-associated translation inhibitor RaiA
MNNENEDIKLGGQIELSGFGGLDRSQMIVVKKIVGNYTKKISEKDETFKGIKVTMKKISSSNMFELNVNLDVNNGPITASIDDRNLFFAIDKVLEKVFNQL